MHIALASEIMSGDGFQSLLGHSRNARSGFHGERLQALSIFVQSVYPLIQELGVRKAVVEQIAADGAQPDEICARLRMQEEICPPGHFVSRRSETMSFCPSSLCELFTRVAMTG